MDARTIVVAVDAGERTMDALRLGEDFARALEAPVVLFDVVEAQVVARNSPAREPERISEQADVGLIVAGPPTGDGLVASCRAPSGNVS